MLSTIVLTAGFGTRLDPLTRLVAKPAVPLGRSTLVEHILAWLARQGVDDVVLNLHHRPQSIAAAVGDGSHLGVRVRYSWEHPLLGSAGGLRHALPLLASDPFLIVNGDTLCDVSIPALLEVHVRSGADATLAVMPNPAPAHYSGLVLDDEGRMTGWVPKGRAEGSWHFVGIQIVNRRLLAGLPDGAPAETVRDVYLPLVARGPGPIRGVRVPGPFLDVGTPQDYLQTALTLRARETPDRTSGVRVEAGATLLDCVVWPEATIGTGAHLERCIVAGPVVLPPGFRARGEILVPAALHRAADAGQVHGGVLRLPVGP